MTHKIIRTLTTITLLVLAGCGGQATEPRGNVSVETPSTIDEVQAETSLGAGSVSGSVSFTGAVPARSAISMSADPYCANAQVNLTAETLIVSSEGGVRNAFVYLTGHIPGDYAVPAEAAILNQQNCRYEPHAQGVRAGQELAILNSDSTLHNVRSLAKINKSFNLGMPIRGMKLTKTFTEPEHAIRFKCDVHPWMSAHVGVFDHPFFEVTGDDGSFRLEGIPAGTYTLAVWHETLGMQTKAIEILDNQTKKESFIFSS